MGKGSGLIEMLATKYGATVHDVKSAIMKAAMGAYKKMKAELGVGRLPKPAFIMILKHVVPTAWRIAREGKIPTAEEVYATVVQSWPNWKAELTGHLRAA